MGGFTPIYSRGLSVHAHPEARVLETASGKELCVTHTPAIQSNLFCLAHNRLSRIRNAVKNKVRWPRKPTLREIAKQTSTCHFQDETERLLNVAQKMLCKQKIGFCLPALDFQFSLASGGCFFSSLSVCIARCFHLNLLAYPCSQTDSSSALTNLKAGRESPCLAATRDTLTCKSVTK